MKNYLQVANSNLLYVLAGFMIIFVMVQSVIFLRLAWRRGIEIGLTKEKMLKTVKSSAVFAIVPSIPIVISLIAITPVLGTPFSWMRLSIIGSNSYELIAADIGAKSMGVKSLGASGYTPVVFANSMWVMSIGIIWGLLACVIFLKRYQHKMTDLREKDSRWSEIMVNALFFGMLSVFLGKPVTEGGMQLLVLISSGVVMIILTYIAKIFKAKWLNDFALSLSMVAGMALAILYTSLQGGI
ncbi:MAG: DUF5058 family protein [Clostridiaceae bacterium]